MKKYRIPVIVLAFIAIGAIATYLSLLRSIPESPADAFEQFSSSEVAEDQIMDPLILVGEGVIPLLVEAVPKRDMPRRRYAISALANLEADAAVPTLSAIAQDGSEPEYIRCDALNAVALISFDAGLDLANELQDSASACLATTSDEIINEDYSRWRDRHYMRRTYMQALMGRHS